MKKFNIDKKVAIITGATGGIGKAVSKKLHSEGAIIIATDLNKGLLDALVDELGNSRVMGLELDCTNKEQLDSVRSEILKEYGRVDFVFANAGISCDPPETVSTMNVDVFEKIIEVDLLGVTRTVKTFLSDIRSNGGHILVTSSVYAFMNGVLNTPYAVSKAGVEMFGRSLRSELAGTGATAGVLYPGWTDTDIAKNAFGGDALTTKLVKRFYKGPYGKTVTPDFVAACVSKGIKTRKRSIFAPKRWVPLSFFRGAFNLLVDAVLDNDKETRKILGAIEKKSAYTGK